MGPRILSSRSQDTQAMQSKMDGVVGSWHSEDRMVQGGRRKAASSGEVDADTVEDYCTHRRQNSNTVPGEISEASG